MEDEVLANAGVDVFEELFKLIFTKLYDEMESWRDRKKHLVFRNYGDTETVLKAKIQDLFDKARGKWEGVFTEDSKLQLTPSHLSVCISSLESVMLFNSNLDVVDEAFEYLINKSSKGEKGQYFTPRYVIDMCVKMLNPQEHETLIDTAAGSCGFPVHGIFHVWEAILKSEGLTKSHLFTAEQKPPRCIDYVQNKVFAIDFDEKAVRVGRTLNLIAGDGQTNVLHLNTLDYERWDEKTKDENWTDIYGEGWKKLRKMRTDKNSNRDFQFDILMANPPFAGDIKETRILAKYELGKKDNGKYQTSVGRDILFIERNLSFLKAGGRMAVVLPQGRFNNSSDKQIREFIAGHCRILAVVGLHGNVFKPHTGTKTSVLLVQKWDDVLCPKVDDYPIFFATMQESSKDNSGDKIYVTQADGSPLLDTHEHLIVKHDLFNHDGLTQDGIAEAFIEFAKKENLSFFDLDLQGFKNLAGLYAEPFNEVKYLALLERLEISEINLSHVENNFRLDPEFYGKHFRLITEKIKSKPHQRFGDMCHLFDGPFGSDFHSSGYAKDGVPIIRMQNIKKSGIFDDTDIEYVSYEDAELLKKHTAYPYDIITTKIGFLGYTAILPSTNEKYIFRRELTKIVIKNPEILANYLCTFLNTEYGRKQAYRFASGTTRDRVLLINQRDFVVPIFSNIFQEAIETFLKFEEKIREESKLTYFQAETLLLNALGMADFSPSTENINIKSFKDSFLATGRLDAEYYQPKYDELENKIKNYIPSRSHALRGNEFSTAPAVQDAARLTLHSHAARGNEETVSPLSYKSLNEFIENYSTGYPYKSEDYLENSGVPLIRINNIKKGFLDISNTAYLPIEQMEISEKDIAVEGDILLSMSGTIGNTCVIPEGITALINQRIMRFTPKNYNPLVLMLILNSIMGEYQLERVGTGGVQTNISSNDINKIIIPILPDEIQAKIAELIQQSFTLKAQSEQLLATAKRAVELAIETNEQTALDYITEATNTGIQT